MIDAAKRIAAEHADFQAVRGPGSGDHHTHAFMRMLYAAAAEMYGVDLSESKLCGDTSLAVDFHFPEERTIVEIALGLPNPSSEFEKDILKAIMARESGHPVDTLVLIGRPGSRRKCEQPGRRAVISWAENSHGISIEVHDLPGEPRRRNRHRDGGVR